MLAWFQANKALGYLIVAALVTALIVGIYAAGRYAGKSSCEAAHNAAQLESDTNRAKADAAINKKVPINAARADKLQWLRQYTVGN